MTFLNRYICIFFIFIFNSCISQKEIDINNLVKESEYKLDGIIVKHEKFSFEKNFVDIYTGEVDSSKHILELIRSKGKLDGSNRVSHMAKENNAILAINGGFFGIFNYSGEKLPSSDLNSCYPNNPQPYIALPSRILKINENWYSTFREFNSSVAWKKDGSGFTVGKISVVPYVEYKSIDIKIDSLNKFLAHKSSVVYTPVWGEPILFDSTGLLVIVENKKIVNIIKLSNVKQNLFTVPKNGFLLYVHDKEIFPFFEIGTSIALNVKIESENKEDMLKWQNADYIISGIPYLIKDSKVNLNYPKTSFFYTSHSRTAICQLTNGNFLLLSVTGGDEVSWNKSGLSIPQLAEVMKSKGCVNAINLDGGHSSLFYFNGKILNRSFPASENDCSALHERSVSDAIIVK